MVRFPSLRLKISDQDRDDLIFNLIVENRQLIEVNTFLICTVLEKIGLSVEEIDERMEEAHKIVRSGIENQLASHLDVNEELSDLIDKTRPGGASNETDSESL